MKPELLAIKEVVARHPEFFPSSAPKEKPPSRLPKKPKPRTYQKSPRRIWLNANPGKTGADYYRIYRRAWERQRHKRWWTNALAKAGVKP